MPRLIPRYWVKTWPGFFRFPDFLLSLLYPNPRMTLYQIWCWQFVLVPTYNDVILYHTCFPCFTRFGEITLKAVYFGDHHQISLLILTHLFQTHPSLPPENIRKSYGDRERVHWEYQGIEQGCIGNKWVKRIWANWLLPRNNVKTIAFLMISGGTEVNSCAWIRLILKTKFNNDPWLKLRTQFQNVNTASLPLLWSTHFWEIS